MFAFLLKFISPDSLKYLSYIIVAVIAFIILWTLYSNIRENAEKDVIIKQQTNVIETQKQTIAKMELISNLKDQHVAFRDIEVKSLEERLDAITVNLGEDANDAAPESIKELFRRLNK